MCDNLAHFVPEFEKIHIVIFVHVTASYNVSSCKPADSVFGCCEGVLKMDALDHMLTDPLESGMDRDGRVMEECMLGNCRVRVPEDLLEDVMRSSNNYKETIL